MDASLTHSPQVTTEKDDDQEEEEDDDDDEKDMCQDSDCEDESLESISEAPAPDHTEIAANSFVKSTPPSKKKRKGDPQARWVKRGKKSIFGYKRHYAVDAETGLVLGVSTPSASVHDSRLFEALMEKSSPPPVVLSTPTKAT